MSGLQLLVRLVPRAFQPEIAVILLTGQELRSMDRVSKTNGAQAYMAKSRISTQDLVSCIHKALARIGPKKNRAHSL
jgi:FixJ family two-component response regulator